MSKQNTSNERAGAPIARPRVMRERLRKLESSVVGTVTSTSDASRLPSGATGALVFLCQFLARQSTDELSINGASIQRHLLADVLERRGMVTNEVEHVLSELVASGVIRRAGNLFTVPSADEPIRKHLANFDSRSAGRSKIGSVNGKEPLHIVTSTAKQASVPTVQGQHFETVSQVATGTAAKRAGRKQLKLGCANRFGATDGQDDGEDDAVVARIVCECGGTAEITQGYIDYLQDAYRSIDVLDCVRKAAVWCDGNRTRRKTLGGIRKFLAVWLSNTSREASVRAAVVRAGSIKGNGFGHGGGYQAPQCVETPDTHDLDFSDLEVHEEVNGMVSNPKISPVQAARARRSTSSPSQARQTAQLRLSQQLS